jgi:hypothetical protein
MRRDDRQDMDRVAMGGAPLAGGGVDVPRHKILCDFFLEISAMSAAASFNAAFRAALGEEAEEEALAIIWDQISRRLPRRTDLGGLSYTEATAEEQRLGVRPYCSTMDGLLEHYSKPLRLKILRSGGVTK